MTDTIEPGSGARSTGAPVTKNDASVVERMRLAALADVHLVDTPPEERFDRITRLAKEIFDVPVAEINLLGEFEQFTKSPQAAGAVVHSPVNESFCQVAVQTPGMLVVRDATQDSRFATRTTVTGERHIRFYAGRPLSLGDDLRIGTLCLVDTVPREMSAAELSVLDEMGLWVERELRDSHPTDGESGPDVAAARIPNPPTPTPGITSPADLDDAQRTSPTSVAITTPTFSIAAASLPVRRVGSDFFAWHEVDGIVEMTVADVMGTGAVAAAVAAVVRDTLEVHAGADVGEALRNANADLSRDLRLAGIFATLFHARIEVETGIIEYADAGHGLTLIVRAGGTIERLESSGFPLGLMKKGTWAVRSSMLQEGDMLVSFSDGVLALFDGTLASLDEVVALVRSSVGTHDVVDRVVALNKRKRGGDDVTIIALSRTE